MEPRKTGLDPRLLRLMMPHRMSGDSEDVQARITEALKWHWTGLPSPAEPGSLASDPRDNISTTYLFTHLRNPILLERRLNGVKSTNNSVMNKVAL